MLGTPVPRVDLPAMVDRPVRVRPQRARARACCTAASSGRRRSAATLMSVDEGSVSAGCPAFVKVVVKKNFVGVVAEKPWQAIQAAPKLKATWTPGPALPAQASFYDYLRNSKPTRDTFVVDLEGRRRRRWRGRRRS